MAIYRGEGGAGDATADASNAAALADSFADAANASAGQAATSAAAALAAKTAAETAETNAETAETNAEAAEAAAVVAKDAAEAVLLDTGFSVVASDLQGDDNIGTVADDIVNVNAVGANIAAVIAVDANEANINIVAADGTDIGTVATSIADVNSVADNIADVTAVADNETNIDAVAANNANITTVAGISGNVTTVAGISANVTTVAGVSANVTTVATNIANVNSVGTNIANVNSVAGNSTNINAVAGNSTNINTVAGISANVTTVATNNANVTTVAGSIANVNTNATNIANINQNAANIVAIQNASANATAAASSATAAAGSATSASASAAAASAVALGNEPVRHSVRPSLLLDFANTKTLDPRITFTRASTGTFYDGKTVAKAEENLALQSQTFATSPWSGSNVTVNQNTGDTTAPDGTSTAAKLTANAGTFNHFRTQVNTSISGADYTTSFFAKKGTNNFVQIYISNQSGSYANFDLDSGVIGTNASVTSASITSVGNDWYRCVVVWVASGTNRYPTLKIAQTASDTGAMSWAAAGTEALYVWGFQHEQRSSVTAYTATTTAPITNYIPALQTAASGVARFEHNPITGESLGLEIEEQRTNLLTYSDDASNAAWSKLRASITSNTIVAPDGTLTGDRLVEDTTASNTHLVQQSVTVANATAHTFSFYAKESGRSLIRVQFTGIDIYFNISLGTVPIQTTGTGTITAVGNGWYRCTATGTSTTTSASATISLTDGSTHIYTGNGWSGAFLWGAQLEAGAFATSYIPTVASQVTRSADAVSMTGTNFSSWYRADEGTVYQDVRPTILNGNYSPFWINTNATNGMGSFLSTAFHLYVVNGNVTQAGIDAGTVTANTDNKIGFVYKTNDFAAVINGGTVGTDTSGTLPVVNRVDIGNFNNNIMSGTIKKLAYYPARLTNAELVGLSTI
jgi:hypothetical protein